MSKCEDKKNLAEYWGKEISEWKASSLTVVEYCRRKNIGRHQFFYWKRKLSRKSESVSFIEVPRLRPSPVPTPVSVKTGRFTVEIKSGFDPADLEQVLRVLVEL